eukprot:884423_1
MSALSVIGSHFDESVQYDMKRIIDQYSLHIVPNGDRIQNLFEFDEKQKKKYLEKQQKFKVALQQLTNQPYRNDLQQVYAQLLDDEHVSEALEATSDVLANHIELSHKEAFDLQQIVDDIQEEKEINADLEEQLNDIDIPCIEKSVYQSHVTVDDELKTDAISMAARASSHPEQKIQMHKTAILTELFNKQLPKYFIDRNLNVQSLIKNIKTKPLECKFNLEEEESICVGTIAIGLVKRSRKLSVVLLRLKSIRLNGRRTSVLYWSKMNDNTNDIVFKFLYCREVVCHVDRTAEEDVMRVNWDGKVLSQSIQLKPSQCTFPSWNINLPHDESHVLSTSTDELNRFVTLLRDTNKSDYPTITKNVYEFVNLPYHTSLVYHASNASSTRIKPKRKTTAPSTENVSHMMRLCPICKKKNQNIDTVQTTKLKEYKLVDLPQHIMQHVVNEEVKVHEDGKWLCYFCGALTAHNCELNCQLKQGTVDKYIITTSCVSAPFHWRTYKKLSELSEKCAFVNHPSMCLISDCQKIMWRWNGNKHYVEMHPGVDIPSQFLVLGFEKFCVKHQAVGGHIEAKAWKNMFDKYEKQAAKLFERKMKVNDVKKQNKKDNEDKIKRKDDQLCALRNKRTDNWKDPGKFLQSCNAIQLDDSDDSEEASDYSEEDSDGSYSPSDESNRNHNGKKSRFEASDED